MAEKRKVLNEIEKCFKKIDEGFEIFDEIMAKMSEANSDNQREKFQDDLKKEIKKLQRLRDQIKGWQNSPDIKDKDQLTNYRKYVEQRMETFKDIERENKTKPHSNQGLSAEDKLDPKEQEKIEAIEWLNIQIRRIQDEIDRTESKLETIVTPEVGRKRGKKDESKKLEKEKIEDLKKHLEKVKFHLLNWEIVMRLITNEMLDIKTALAKLKEPIEIYIEALEPDNELDHKNLGPEDIYEELNLNSYIPVLGCLQIGQTDEEKAVEAAAAAISGVIDKKPVPEYKANLPTSTPNNLSPCLTPSPKECFLKNSSFNQRQSTKNSSISDGSGIANIHQPQTRIPYNSVAAGHLSQPTGGGGIVSTTTPLSATCSGTPILVRNSPSAANKSTTISPSNQPTTAINTTVSSNNLHSSICSNGHAPTTTQNSSKAVTPASSFVHCSFLGVGGGGGGSSNGSISPTIASPTSINNFSAVENTLQKALNMDSTEKLADFMTIEALSDPLPISVELENQLRFLDEAASKLPSPIDSEKTRTYLPKSLCPMAPYPTDVPENFDTLDYYLQLSSETLFFIFYYMEGTRAQLYAARALKRRSWRFHTKYLMWFQRHEEPKQITEEFEIGTYVYFDFERWSQRKKDMFTFEYEYLEDVNLD